MVSIVININYSINLAWIISNYITLIRLSNNVKYGVPSSNNCFDYDLFKSQCYCLKSNEKDYIIDTGSLIVEKQTGG